ncbi:MAG TPA: CHASE domain-containing protein, partial [Polyangiaceae bacterium]
MSRTFGLASFRNQPLAFAVLLIGLALTSGAFVLLQARERQAARLSFERRAARTVVSFRASLERPLEVLRTLPALFEASEDVTRFEFRTFVRPALSRHPDIMALGWMPRVTAGARMAFEDAARRDGLPNFEITELRGADWVRAADRPEYYPIFYVEPDFPRFIGFDEASEAGRAEALARARDGGEPAASRRIVLLGDRSDVAGIIVFVPIYARGVVPSDETARRQLLRGFVVEVFRFPSVFEGLKKLEDLRGLELELFDVTEPGHKEPLYGFRGPGEPARRNELVSTDATLPFAGRSWLLAIRGPAPVAATPWVVLGVGVLASALAAAGTGALATLLRLRRRMQ